MYYVWTILLLDRQVCIEEHVSEYIFGLDVMVRKKEAYLCIIIPGTN